MSETITRPNVTTQPETDPLRIWTRRVIMPTLPPRPMPLQQTNNRTRPLPQMPPLPDPSAGYRAAYDAAKPTIYRAMGVSAPTPEVVQAKQDLTDQVDAMTALATDRKYPQALRAVPGVVDAARKVIALGDVAGVKAKQLRVQQGQFEEIKGVCDEVVRTYFNAGAASSSGRVRKEKLNAGRHFKDYLTALETVEQTRGALPKQGPIPPNDAETARQACDALVTVAEDYLKHFEQDLSKREQADKTNQRKFQIVTEGLKAARQFSLAMQVQAIDAPTEQQPWDRKTEAKIGGLRAAVNFETGYKKGSDLRDVGGAGASSAFWVESKPPGQTKATKNFIFKPVRGEQSPAPDDRPGAGAAKEALASANAKLFEQQTGISLGIPETQVTTIGSHALDLKDNDNDGQPRVGSLQEFAPSDGALAGTSSGVRKQIPGKECQKIALHDIMALNFDRHAGNLLMKAQGGNAPELVPIDHGCTLPTRKDFAQMAKRIGGLGVPELGATLPEFAKTLVVQNAVLTLPGAYEPFDPDTLAKLDLLDPEAMVQGMRDQLDALDEVNPGLDSKTKVAPESLQMSKRSMMFMKLAARELSAAEIQIAIGQHGEELFDADDAHFEGIAGRVIADMKPKKGAFEELFTTTSQRRNAIFETLRTNGWTPADGDLPGWMMSDPKAALALFKSGAVNTDAVTDDRGIQRATTKQIADKLATLDETQVLRKSIGTLTAQTIDHLTNVDPTEAGRLDPLREEVKRLLAAGDVAGAEAKAREVETDALDLGLAAARVDLQALLELGAVKFANMGTDEVELAKRAKLKPDAAQAVVVRVYARRNFELAHEQAVVYTGNRPDLAEARGALQTMRRIAGA